MPRFKVTACTAEHIGDRPDQQDRVAVLTSPRHPNSVLAVVSDGMGGRTGGRMAAGGSALAVDGLAGLGLLRGQRHGARFLVG